jgi:hypothetical protein
VFEAIDRPAAVVLVENTAYLPALGHEVYRRI